MERATAHRRVRAVLGQLTGGQHEHEMMLCAGSCEESMGGRKRSCVAVLGAGGGIGQPLSLLLLSKLQGLVHSLRLYDIGDAVRGVAADLSHVDVGCAVQAYVGEASLREALEGVDVVVIPAGVPRKPGAAREMTMEGVRGEREASSPRTLRWPRETVLHLHAVFQKNVRTNPVFPDLISLSFSLSLCVCVRVLPLNHSHFERGKT